MRAHERSGHYSLLFSFTYLFVFFFNVLISNNKFDQGAQSNKLGGYLVTTVIQVQFYLIFWFTHFIFIFLGGGVPKYWRKKIWPIFSPFYAFLNNLNFCYYWPTFFGGVPYFFGGGPKIQKSFSTTFLAISCNFEQLWFFSFLTNIFVRPKSFFFGGGGLKSPKTTFDQFSRHFRQFWTTLIFFIFDKKNLYAH